MKVADFTSRLPGPLAGSILADLGAEVIRYEIKGFEDPFFFSKEEPAFKVWAKNLAANKKFKTIEKDDQEQFHTELEQMDVVLCPPSKFFTALAKKTTKPVFIEVAGGRGTQKFLHDLNALFLTRSFKLHLQGQKNPAPPYLPFAGILFAQQIALEVLAIQIAKRDGAAVTDKRIYLDETVKKVLNKLWGPELDSNQTGRFLHNGKYPCYNIYQTSDGGHVGLAAVESRFWSEFCEIFDLELSMDDRFDDSGKTGQKLSDMFLSYKSSEIRKIIGERDICVNLFASK